ncbi:hypothetical protein M8J76_012052 [Diaphorina citri]|nr:hypothetical protein M8J76_012052 [Diaphorina citri]
MPETRLLSAIIGLLCLHLALCTVTKKHDGKKPTLNEHHSSPKQHAGKREGQGHNEGQGRTHGHGAHAQTTTNYVQYKIRNRWRAKNRTSKEFYHTNESMTLESYSFEPLEWSDNRCPPTLMPMDEHVKRWKNIFKEITYPDTSDPEGTLDPNLSLKQRYYQCLYCFAKFDEDTKLDYHYKKRHPDKIVEHPTTTKPIHCAYCLGSFNQSEFRHHQESKHNVTQDRYPWERPPTLNYESFDTKEAQQVFDKRFGGSDEYVYHTYPKNNTFFMTMYDIDSNTSGMITHHYVDPWPNDANV